MLNTMDREIERIALDVRCPQFSAEVKPSQEWKEFPKLRPVGKNVRQGGGKKEYFEVTLKRKPGVPDGTYKIDLHLYNPKNPKQVFKTLDLGDAAGICTVPKAAAIVVDGNATPAEWQSSLSCTGFYEYKKGDTKFNEKAACRDQSIVRVATDKDNLYFCMSFQGGAGAKSDTASVYVAPDMDAAPVKLSVDRISGKVTCEAGTDGVEVKTDAGKTLIEMKVPRKLLKVDGLKSFQANFTREVEPNEGAATVNYWRGTSYSVTDPVEYAQFRIAE
jgi:hypothetical protein